MRWIVYPIAVIVAVALVAVRERSSHGSRDAAGSVGRQLLGRTDQHFSMTVLLDARGRMHALGTRLVGLCENGQRSSIGWSPDAPRIPFRPRGGGTSVRESLTRRYPGGTVGHIEVWTSGDVTSAGRAAAGNARMVASFSHPGQHKLLCDSGYVHWSASARADRGPSAAAAGGPAYYPAVPSLARRVSAARRAFIIRVDQTCATTYNQLQALEAQAGTRNEGRSDRELRVYAAYLSGHAYQYSSIRRLGGPPQARLLYTRWLANMRRRIRLERQYLTQWRRGSQRAKATTSAEINFLKLRGNSLGQEFGLQVCTSNGPFRTPLARPPLRRPHTTQPPGAVDH